MSPAPGRLLARWLGERDYAATLADMRRQVESAGDGSADELWLLSHPPLFTLGQAGRREHLLDPGETPVVASDRGGQVTYHGPGQLVAYVLLDLRSARLGVRRLVWSLEQAVIDLLAGEGVAAERRDGAPGVYVGDAKLAALGLRVRKGRSYHGLALNVDLDLAPFRRIDPCGYRGLEVTRLADLGIPWSVEASGWRLAHALAARLDCRLESLESPVTNAG